MMSTEYSPVCNTTEATAASIVEVESKEDLFKLKSPPGSPEDLMMTEYDEDNVIVIDLSEERNASAKNNLLLDEVQPPIEMFAASTQGHDLNGTQGVLVDEIVTINGDNTSHDSPKTILETTHQDASDEPCQDNNSECLERNQTLTTPPLQKTINESEDVRNHLFDQEVDNTSEFRQESIVKRPESGILPPVLPYKSFSATKRIQNSSSSPKTNTRKSILQRSKTINVPESNGTSTYHDQALTTDTTTDEEVRESRSKKNRKNGKKQRITSSDRVSGFRAISGDATLPRRSVSCRRQLASEDIMRPMTTTTHNIMSMSMIGNSLGGGYGGDSGDAYERRRRARSNDFLDRIDVSVVSTRSAHCTTTASKRKSTPKMSRIEHGLYLGSLDAATDVILLESNAISHIVTVDSVPLPRKITSMMPRIAILHLQVTDLPEEDLLSHFTSSNAFIEDGLAKDGAVLVHCYRGRSRSATVVVAFLMQKHGYSAERALAKVRGKREIIQPHESFLAQLKLYENMDFALDPDNLQFKMFKLHMAAERMRKAKILFRDTLDSVIDPDPAGGLPGSAASILAAASKSRYPMVYKCKRCRRTLATAFNLMPHVQNESPRWTDSKWSLPGQDVLESAAERGLQLCSASLFINPVRWMEPEIRQNMSGKLYCPNCQTKVGQYSWILGEDCSHCEAKTTPSFCLDVTEIIFRTKNRFLQSNQREPVVV